MPVKKRWDMVLAARLLQWGAAGKDVARVVGCVPSEISRCKAELLAMEVEPMTDTEAEQLIGKKPFKLQEDPAEDREPVETQDDQSESVPVVEDKRPQKGISPPPMILEKQAAPEIVVDIHIGRGMVHLEAENTRVLETLINMLVAMGGGE